jgi:endoribonuclease Dicer
LRDFRLFFAPQQASNCRVLPIRTPQLITAHMAEWLGQFTLRIFGDIFSKEYKATSADLPYFLAPCSKHHNHDFGSVLEPHKIIDWATLQFVAETRVIAVPEDAADAFFVDKFVTDPWSGARKFILRKRRHDLKPLDPVPAGVAYPAGTGWKGSRKDIMNYSVSLWSKARATGKFVWREVQPVVEAEMVSLRRNLLDDQFSPVDDEKSDTCFLILEPLRISPVSGTVVHGFLLM